MLRIEIFVLIFMVGWSINTGNILLFPQNTVFQLTIGISVPVAMDKRGGIAFTSGFQFNYVLPSNLSQISPDIVSARKAGNFDLQDVYVVIEDLLYEYNWRYGGQCLLRTICELAEIPLIQRESNEDYKQDVLEEIIHLLLTPSEDLPEPFESSHRSVNNLYREAERWGRSGRDCIQTYPDCIESPLASFTEVVFP